MDRLTPEQRRKNMQHVRNKDSKIKLKLRKALWHAGLRYLRLGVEKLRAEGWTVIRFFGREITKNIDECVRVVVEAVNQKKAEAASKCRGTR